MVVNLAFSTLVKPESYVQRFTRESIHYTGQIPRGNISSFFGGVTERDILRRGVFGVRWSEGHSRLRLGVRNRDERA